MSRDAKFFSELKQLNEDLLEALKKYHSKSAYNDFSPTLLDYIKQFEGIEKKYPKGSNGLSNTFASITTPAATVTSATTSSITATSITTSSTLNTTTTNSTNPAVSTNSTFAPSSITTSTANNTNGPMGFKFSSTGFNLPSSDSLSNSINNKPSFLFGSAITNPPTTTSAPLFTFGSALNQAPAQAPLFSFTLPKPPAPSASTEPTVAESEEADEPTNPPEPNVDKYEETDAKVGVRVKLYEKTRGDAGQASYTTIGVGMIYVKACPEDPNKLQVIFRQDPDLRRVLFNEIVTAQMPAPKLGSKTVQMVFPPKDQGGKPRFYVAKFANDDDAKKFLDGLSFAQT